MKKNILLCTVALISAGAVNSCGTNTRPVSVEKKDISGSVKYGSKKEWYNIEYSLCWPTALSKGDVSILQYELSNALLKEPDISDIKAVLDIKGYGPEVAEIPEQYQDWEYATDNDITILNIKHDISLRGSGPGFVSYCCSTSEMYHTQNGGPTTKYNFVNFDVNTNTLLSLNDVIANVDALNAFIHYSDDTTPTPLTASDIEGFILFNDEISFYLGAPLYWNDVFVEVSVKDLENYLTDKGKAIYGLASSSSSTSKNGEFGQIAYSTFGLKGKVKSVTVTKGNSDDRISGFSTPELSFSPTGELIAFQDIRIIYDEKGNYKSATSVIQYESQDVFINKIDFDSKHRITKINITESVKDIDYECDRDGYTFSYNEEGRLSGMTIQDSCESMDISFGNTTYEEISGNYVPISVEFSLDLDSGIISYNYSMDNAFDSHGNWIERKGVIIEYSEMEGCEDTVTRFVEKRTIEYYE